MNTKHINRPVCLTRLALRRALTVENIACAFILAGTAAAVAVTAYVGAIVLRLL